MKSKVEAIHAEQSGTLTNMIIGSLLSVSTEKKSEEKSGYCSDVLSLSAKAFS